MALSAYSDHELSVYSSFDIEITLTKNGLDNVNDVIAAIFKYAQRLKEVGPQQYVFDECQKIGRLKFDFLSKNNGTQYCVKLARKMPNFKSNEELKHLISSQYLYHEFDKQRIEQIAAMIADPQNTFSSVLSKSFKDEELPLLEPWY